MTISATAGAQLSLADKRELLARASASKMPVRGLTHTFYRYPARFSPEFAGAAIELFSQPGDVVLDPFMGGGTTIVEAFSRGRLGIGSDINELSHFIARSKTTLLRYRGLRRVEEWFGLYASSLNFRTPVPRGSLDAGCQNLLASSARPIRKLTRLLLHALDDLPRQAERRFARCAILKTAQWALDNRRQTPSLDDFRWRLISNAQAMILGMLELTTLALDHAKAGLAPRLGTVNAGDADALACLCNRHVADLVVTSPPYPGVHVLYHRWQINGRRETSAPYWIAGARDGKGGAYYNFAERRSPTQERFFATYEASLRAMRDVMRKGGTLVQMLACRNPEAHLSRLCESISKSGFRPLAGDGSQLIWRDVPGRKWHANLKGALASAKEVVLLHEAI